MRRRVPMNFPARIIATQSTNAPRRCKIRNGSRLSLSATLPWQEEIRLAIQDTKLGQSSIDAAHTACSRWESILEPNIKRNTQSPSSSQAALPAAVETLCFAMYASCLVRTGQDDKAIGVYEQALLLLANKDDPTSRDLLLGKAKAHQRLLQYSDALDAYYGLVIMARDHKIPLDSSDVVGAVTCSLRLEQPQQAHEVLWTAIKLLQKEHETQKMGPEQSHRVQRDLVHMKLLLSIARRLLGTENCKEETSEGFIDKKQTETLLWSLRNEYPLFAWLHALKPLQDIQGPPLSSDKSVDDDPIRTTNDAFLALMKVNQSPWDDPLLLQLDDKVLLHQLLSINRAHTSKFWPMGYVVPTDLHALVQYEQKSSGKPTSNPKWIAKARAGYGSHGNQIMSVHEAMKNVGSGDNSQGSTAPKSTEFLLQKLVDPTLLINGRKFSLRLYLVYFTPDECYLSCQGLVKLAALEATAGESEESARRAFMTNSGREQQMEQRDLHFLQHESKLFETNSEYASFWSKIQESVKQVMISYRDCRCESQNNHDQQDFEYRRQALGIPKILGLDYLIDTEYQPWMLEVNRFPGLEPRDESDRLVKHQIVRDAWLCAQERLLKEARDSEINSPSGDHHPLQYVLDHLPPVSKDCPYVLERLH